MCVLLSLIEEPKTKVTATKKNVAVKDVTLKPHAKSHRILSRLVQSVHFGRHAVLAK